MNIRSQSIHIFLHSVQHKYDYSKEQQRISAAIHRHLAIVTENFTDHSNKHSCVGQNTKRYVMECYVAELDGLSGISCHAVIYDGQEVLCAVRCIKQIAATEFVVKQEIPHPLIMQDFNVSMERPEWTLAVSDHR